MIASLLRNLPLALMTSGLLAASAASAAPKYKTSMPPSAQLQYSIKAKEKGIPVEGSAVMHWTVANRQFSATNEARAMLVGKILDARTEGTIDAFGIAPVTFTEKRVRRKPSVTTFDRAAKTIRFSASEETYPIKGGEQDRNSVIWQLIAVARAAPAKFKPGSSWVFLVAGQRKAEEWTFKVDKQEKIDTPLGALNALHVVRVAPSDSKDQQLDIWLAPSLEWYPARVRFSDNDGDYIEQTLQKVEKKAS